MTEPDTTSGAAVTQRKARRMAREPNREADASTPPATMPTSSAPSPAATRPAPAPRAAGKTDAVLALLRREHGATLAELTAATGWLSHSARAVLTGLRKKGHAIERTKHGDVSHYRIAEPA